MDAEAGDSIKDRVAFVFDQIRRATRKAGREDGSVQLVAATKSVTETAFAKAVDAGVTLAGENRLQEALPKIEALKRHGRHLALHRPASSGERSARWSAFLN